MLNEKSPAVLKKIKADSSQKRYSFAVIISTVLLILFAYLLGRFALPLVYLEVHPTPICPVMMEYYNGFCGFMNLSNGNYWRSYLIGLNKTNVFILLTGQFHVNPNLNNTHGLLIRILFWSQVHFQHFPGTTRRTGLQ